MSGARQSVRIAGAIEIFVVMPDAVENFCADAPHVFQQVVSDHRMTPA